VSFGELAPGEVFGEYAAVDHCPRSASVEARTSCLIASMPAAAFRALLQTEPMVTLAVLTQLVRRTRQRPSPRSPCAAPTFGGDPFKDNLVYCWYTIAGSKCVRRTALRATTLIAGSAVVPLRLTKREKAPTLIAEGAPWPTCGLPKK
jgi:hypothetical protein